MEFLVNSKMALIRCECFCLLELAPDGKTPPHAQTCRNAYKNAGVPQARKQEHLVTVDQGLILQPSEFMPS